MKKIVKCGEVGDDSKLTDALQGSSSQLCSTHHQDRNSTEDKQSDGAA